MFATERHTRPTGYAALADAGTTDWGPARHDPARPPLHGPNDGFGLALRDDDDARPDDN